MPTFLIHSSMCQRECQEIQVFSGVFLSSSCPPLYMVGKEMFCSSNETSGCCNWTKKHVFRAWWSHKSAGISNFYMTPADVRKSVCMHRLKIHWTENPPAISPVKERHTWDARADILILFYFLREKCLFFPIVGNHKSEEASRMMRYSNFGLW